MILISFPALKASINRLGGMGIGGGSIVLVLMLRESLNDALTPVIHC